MKSFFFSNEKVLKMFFKFFLPEYSTTCKIFQISKQWKSNDHEEWGKTSPPNNLISSWVGSCEWCSVPMRNLMRNPYYYLALFFQNPFRCSWRVEHDAISFCDKSLFLDLVKFSHLLQKKTFIHSDSSVCVGKRRLPDNSQSCTIFHCKRVRTVTSFLNASDGVTIGSPLGPKI